MQSDRIIRMGHRLPRRREKRKIRLLAVEHEIEMLRLQVAVAGHERQFGVDLAREHEVTGARSPEIQKIERQVRVAAQAVTASLPGDELRDHVHAARERKTAKIWLEPVQLEHNDGFAQNELNKLLAVVRDHQAVLLRAWHDFFGTDYGTGAGGKGSGH